MDKNKTANRVAITPGLKVWTNDLKRGVVLDDAPHMERNYNTSNGPVYPAPGSETPWFYVEVDGYRDSFDGSRLTTVHPFTGEAA